MKKKKLQTHAEQLICNEKHVTKNKYVRTIKYKIYDHLIQKFIKLNFIGRKKKFYD